VGKKETQDKEIGKHTVQICKVTNAMTSITGPTGKEDQSAQELVLMKRHRKILVPSRNQNLITLSLALLTVLL
jgi:hypothetical protein